MKCVLYISSSHHGKVRSDTAASLLTLKVLGPQFGNQCARGAESQPVNSRTSQKAVSVELSDEMSAVSVTIACVDLRFCQQDPETLTVSSSINTFSIYSSLRFFVITHYIIHMSRPSAVCLHSMKTRHIYITMLEAENVGNV